MKTPIIYNEEYSRSKADVLSEEYLVSSNDILYQGSSIRTANTFNNEYMYRIWLDETSAASKPRKNAVIRSIIFYSILFIMVVLAFFYSNNNSPGKKFGSFAYNTVLTESMKSVYPPGSLITSWAVKPGEPLKAGMENGTDIVFVKDESCTVVVHRIIEIIEDYEESGQRAFRTQGVDNPEPDHWITYEGNVIGRVMWHMPYAGDILAFIGENILWVIIIITVLTAILTLMKIAFRKET